jgi:hypothetical protein
MYQGVRLRSWRGCLGGQRCRCCLYPEQGEKWITSTPWDTGADESFACRSSSHLQMSLWSHSGEPVPADRALGRTTGREKNRTAAGAFALVGVATALELVS